MTPLDAACLARLAGVPAAEVPPERKRRSWLAARGLGLVEGADPAAFTWPGPFAARIADGNGERDVVLFGVPPGVLLAPRGELPSGTPVVARAAWVLAELDPAEPFRPAAEAGEG